MTQNADFKKTVRTTTPPFVCLAAARAATSVAVHTHPRSTSAVTRTSAGVKALTLVQLWVKRCVRVIVCSRAVGNVWRWELSVCGPSGRRAFKNIHPLVSPRTGNLIPPKLVNMVPVVCWFDSADCFDVLLCIRRAPTGTQSLVS